MALTISQRTAQHMDWQDLLGRKVGILTENGISPLIREQVFAEAKPL
ncbi:MAG: hypothetical protein AAFY33_19665 [Cyanobacteria bacterium J06643_4]